jgi:hypothetical protein
MIIDDCKNSFDELTAHTLPAHFVRLTENMKIPIPATWIRTRGVGLATVLREMGRAQDFSGCYVFIENDKPLYVGISRSVIKRLFQHLTSSSHYSGSLAYFIAKRQNDPGGTRDQNMASTDFRKLFEASQRRLEACTIGVVEIDNYVELHLFEVYAAMQLNTGEFNTFKTH